MRMIFSLIAWLAIITYLPSCSSAVFKRSPIILVPGDGGSQLEVKLDKPSVVHYFCERRTDDFSNIWLTISDLVPLVIDCWADNMRLEYDNITRTSRSPPGVHFRVPGFGQTDTIEYIDPIRIGLTGYFNHLVDKLVKNVGYVRGLDIRGAPYDFRRAPNELGEFYTNFSRLIEDTYITNGQEKVVIVCHSMGCPVTLYFLNRQSKTWKDKHIKSMVSLAGAWGGSIKAFKAFASGDNFGVVVIKELTVRKDERTFPSLAFLMPSLKLWSANQTFIRTPSANYSLSNLERFYRDINLTSGYDMYLDTKDLIRELKAPEVELHCLYGTGVDTVEFMTYDDKFPDSKPDINWGNGDGTVNEMSLNACIRWKGQQRAAINLQTYKKVDHMSIMADDRIIQYIQDVAVDNDTLS